MAINSADLNQDALSKLQAKEQFPQVQEQNVVKVKIARDTIQGQVSLALEMMKNGQTPVIDISKLPHYASLSPKIMKHFFEGNRVDYPNFDPRKGISRNDPKPKYEGNLQYLVGETPSGTYLNLSKEHQEFVKKVADTILTDEFALNIEDHKKDRNIPYLIVSEGEKNLKTSSLGYILRNIIVLLHEIEDCQNSVQDTYDVIVDRLNKYKEKKGYNDSEKIVSSLETLKPEIDGVLQIHKFLKEKGMEQAMDYRKREKAILDEIKRLQAKIKEKETKIKEKDDILAGKKGILKEQNDRIKEKEAKIKEKEAKIKEQNDILAGKKGILKEQNEEIKKNTEEIKKNAEEIKKKKEEIEKMKRFIKAANRFLDVTGRS